MSHRSVLTTVAVWLGLAFSLLAWGLYRLSFDAFGVVVDARTTGVALAAVSLLLAAPGLKSGGPGGGFRVRRAAAVAAALVAALAGGLLARDLLFAYRAEKVRFSNGEIPLAGTLYLPRAAAPHAAVILGHGAGEETRKEGEFYARLFARRGIAALAYDKRGCAGGNPDVTVQVFPRGEHGLVEWWLPGRIPPPRFPERCLPLTVDWTLARVSQPSPRGAS